MAKKDKTGWPLPIEVGEPYKCIKIYIPNDQYDRGAFWGALFELTYSWNWQQNPPEKAREVSDMWSEIWWDAYERSNGMNCCDDQPVEHRYNPETGRPEVSYDGGATWREDPNDIQNQIPLYPPLVTGGGGKTKCDAATNASEHINELIEATKTNLETATTVFSLAQAVAEAALAIFIVIVSGGTLSPLVATLMAAIWAAAQGVFALGIEAYDAYWTVDKKDAILCALYCNIGENGQFTEAQYQSFRSKVKSTLPASPAFDIVMTTINAGGATGLSQMASYGNAAEADCSSCDCVSCECDIQTFIAAGTYVSCDGNHMTVNSVDDGGGKQAVYLVYGDGTTYDVNKCRTIDHYTVDVGSVDVTGWNACHTGTLSFVGVGGCAAQAFWQNDANVPFTVTIYFVDGCTDCG